MENEVKKQGLKIVVITQGVSRILEPLMTSGHNICGVIESAPRNYHVRPVKVMLSRAFAHAFSFLSKRKSSLKVWCFWKNVSYFFLHKQNLDEARKWIEIKSPDVIVVFGMSQLLPKEIIEIAEKGAINLHPAYLPDYRGPNPDFWQYYNMELNPGATVHFIDEREDTGDIIHQKRIEIPLGIKSPDRLDLLIGELGTTILMEVLKQIESGTVTTIRQADNSSTQRARNVKRSEHKKIIDWQEWPIERIWNLLRGTEQWLEALPRPKGFLGGQRWSVEGYEKSTQPCGVPGEVYQDHRGLAYVCTKEGKIFLKKIFCIKSMILWLLKV